MAYHPSEHFLMTLPFQRVTVGDKTLGAPSLLESPFETVHSREKRCDESGSELSPRQVRSFSAPPFLNADE